MRDSSVRKNEKQNKKLRVTAVCAVTSAVFVLIVFGVLALAVATPDREKSESENRVLKQFPAITLSSVFDGSFMKSFETYFNDQFPLRDKLIAFKSGFERMLGKTQENGVYIGKDNFLFEEPLPNPYPPDENYPIVFNTGRGSVGQWHTQSRTKEVKFVEDVSVK
ncbi:MAG: hypothetical protein J6D79_03740, partial [Clostridia bacterium]|nr:hypothetical protein [Clostridia bacterium]